MRAGRDKRTDTGLRRIVAGAVAAVVIISVVQAEATLSVEDRLRKGQGL